MVKVGMEAPGTANQRPGFASQVQRGASRVARRTSEHLQHTLGGRERARVVVALACVLALASADSATVGASALYLRRSLHISNTDIGLLVTVSSLVAAVASLPVRRDGGPLPPHPDPRPGRPGLGRGHGVERDGVVLREAAPRPPRPGRGHGRGRSYRGLARRRLLRGLRTGPHLQLHPHRRASGGRPGLRRDRRYRRVVLAGVVHFARHSGVRPGLGRAAAART